MFGAWGAEMLSRRVSIEILKIASREIVFLIMSLNSLWPTACLTTTISVHATRVLRLGRLQKRHFMFRAVLFPFHLFTSLSLSVVASLIFVPEPFN